MGLAVGLGLAGCPSDDTGATGQDTGATTAATNGNVDGVSATSMVLPTTSGTPTPDPDAGSETSVGSATTTATTGDPTTTGEASTDTGEFSDPVPCQPKAGLDGPVIVGSQSVSAGHTAEDFAGPAAGGGGAFIPTPDGGGNTECDLWSQDCPEGEKCMPWANDGGSSWNASRCSPIAANPNQPGDECMVEGSGVSGIDNCDIGSMCFGVNPADNVGTCIEMCSGSPAAPVCNTPDATCTISNNGFLILCRPICNPLVGECDEGEGCYPIGDVMVCAPDVSGDGGAAGDPCEFINVCDPGKFCGTGVPGCQADGCCSPFCQVGDDGPCLDGQECVPTFPGGAPAACLEDVGQCAAR